MSEAMAKNSIILVGGPDSGKSNYVGRLWLALQSKNYPIIAAETPSNIKYVEGIAEHLLQRRFAPRTEGEETNRDFKVKIKTLDNIHADLIIPDVSGELWKKAVETLEISQQWFDTVRSASSAFLFVRVLSDQIVQPMDWVNSKQFLEMDYDDLERNQEMPTQIALIELLRILEENLLTKSGRKPKVAIIISAWDLLNDDDAAEGPLAYLETNYPLFSGRLKDTDALEVKIFGSSILGGDFSVDDFVKKYESVDFDELGYVVTETPNEKPETIPNITLPIAWLLG